MRATDGDMGKGFRAGKREEVVQVWKIVNGGKGISFLQIHDRLFN